MDDVTRAPGAHMEAELRSQATTWRRALQLTPSVAQILPRDDERVLVVGCGTSYYMATRTRTSGTTPGSVAPAPASRRRSTTSRTTRPCS
ncbi:hypothetical protein [uncultured Amnibacterium sp.]|uniref:hypothetical protein n=1 Tax=uncultured Amnibacterium sp. TaxID=1631851 RepID=UPI0035CB1CF1